MKKLRLQLDDLAVEAFPTTTHAIRRPGTVKGHATFGEHTCIGDTCGSQCPSGNGSCGSLCTYVDCPVTYEYPSCVANECATGACGQPTDNTGCGQATCGNGTCAVNTCPADTV